MTKNVCDFTITYSSNQEVELSIRDVPEDVFNNLVKKFSRIAKGDGWVGTNHISITLAENITVTYWLKIKG